MTKSTPNSLHIAYFLGYFPKLSETFILDEIIELEKTGVRISVFALDSFAHKDRKVHDKALEWMQKTYYINDRSITRQQKLIGLAASSLHPTRMWKAFRNFKNKNISESRWIFNRCLFLSSYFKRLRVDHIHSHYATEATEYAMYTSMLSGIPFSFTTHGNDIYFEPPTDFFYRADRAKFVVAVSEFNKNYISERFKVPQVKIHTICNGVDTSFFQPRHEQSLDNTTSKIPIVLTVARLHSVKGLEYLMHAYKLIKEKSIPFKGIIIGDGPDYNKLQALIEELELDRVVTLMGNRSKEEILQYYQASSIFVLSSISEGMPIVLLESMSCALPVVATEVKGIPELVTSNVNGILVRPKDPYKLSLAIIRFLENPVLANELGKRGRETIEKRFTHTRKIRSLLDLFSSDL